MALFGKNKTSKTSPTSSASQAASDVVNPNDFWEQPIKANSGEVNTNVKIKEITSVTPDVFNGPRGINPKVLEKSMEKLEAELKEREEREPEVYIIDGISERDMSRAELAFEQEVEEIKEMQSAIQYGKIASASTVGIEEKVRELDEKYDYLVHGKKDVDYGFDSISKEEFQRRVSEYDIEKAAQRKEIIRKMPGLTEAQKLKIQEFFDNDVVAEPMDYVNSIPELSKKDLAKIRKRLEEIYALEKEEKPELKIKTV